MYINDSNWGQFIADTFPLANSKTCTTFNNKNLMVWQ